MHERHLVVDFMYHLIHIKDLDERRMPSDILAEICSDLQFDVLRLLVTVAVEVGTR